MTKQLLCFFLFITLSSIVYAQNDVTTPPKALKEFFSNPQKRKASIAKDAISSDGVRWIWGDYRYSFIGTSTKEKSVRIMVLGMQKDTIITYQVCLGIHAADTKLRIEKDSPVLIKFGDNSIYKTKNLFFDEDNVGEAHTLTYSVFYTYDIYAYIELTDELLDGLKKGFKKIRFEVNGDIYDVEPRKDNVSQFIIDEYNLIKEAFNTKRSFTDDF